MTQRIQEAAGLLVHRQAGGAPKFVGSCFSFRRPDVFLTAHHCVDGIPDDSLWVGLPILGNAVSGSLSVVRREAHPQADVALLFVTGVPDGLWYAMADIDHAAGWGERIVTFGYPEDTRADGAVWPTARMSSGNVQRFFDYRDGRGTYRAIECSYPSPAGLSGSPVSRTQDTGSVIAVMTTNHDALSYRGSFEVSDASGNYRAVERDIIRYGIAAYLPDVADWLDEHAPRPAVA